MSSPSGPQQPFPNDPNQFPPPGGQPGQFPPSGGQPSQFPPPGPNQAGGFPPPQGGGFPPPQPPRRGGGWGKRIVTIVIALVVIGGIAAASAYFNRDAANKAAVGDCVSQSGSDDDELTVVACTDAAAKFKVVGRVEDKRQSEASGACEPFAEAESAYWEGEVGKEGLVLCLAPNG